MGKVKMDCEQFCDWGDYAIRNGTTEAFVDLAKDWAIGANKEIEHLMAERDEWKRRAIKSIGTNCHICGALPQEFGTWVLDTEVQPLFEEMQQEIESLRKQLDRHLFVGESVEKIKAEKEIESLRSEVSALREQKIIDDAMIEGRKGEIETLRQKLEEQKQQNEKCHKMRLQFIDEQVQELRKKDKEILSLRNSLQAAKILRDTYKVTEEGWKRKYQILRDNLTPEEYGELCELWPELKK